MQDWLLPGNRTGYPLPELRRLLSVQFLSVLDHVLSVRSKTWMLRSTNFIIRYPHSLGLSWFCCIFERFGHYDLTDSYSAL